MFILEVTSILNECEVVSGASLEETELIAVLFTNLKILMEL